MLGAITPLGKAAHGRRLWLESVTTFTLAGLLTSGLVGGLLGLAGQALGTSFRNSVGLATVLILAALCAARESGLLSIGLLQPRRATRGSLARVIGQPWAALWWGADIGLLFTTWFTFAGTWWLIALTAQRGQPDVSAAILASYWAGRALTVWAGQWLVSSDQLTSLLPEVWYELYPRFARINAIAVLLGAVLLVRTSAWI